MHTCLLTIFMIWHVYKKKTMTGDAKAVTYTQLTVTQPHKELNCALINWLNFRMHLSALHSNHRRTRSCPLHLEDMCTIQSLIIIMKRV